MNEMGSSAFWSTDHASVGWKQPDTRNPWLPHSRSGGESSGGSAVAYLAHQTQANSFHIDKAGMPVCVCCYYRARRAKVIRPVWVALSGACYCAHCMPPQAPEKRPVGSSRPKRQDTSVRAWRAARTFLSPGRALLPRAVPMWRPRDCSRRQGHRATRRMSAGYHGTSRRRVAPCPYGRAYLSALAPFSNCI